MRTSHRRATAAAVTALLIPALAACGSGGDEPAAKESTKSSPSASVSESASPAAESSGGPTRVEADFSTGDASGWPRGPLGKGSIAGVQDGSYYVDIVAGDIRLLAPGPMQSVKPDKVALTIHHTGFGPGNPASGLACMAQLDADGNATSFYDILISRAGNASVYKVLPDDAKEIVAPVKIPDWDPQDAPTLILSCIRSSTGVGFAVADETGKTIVSGSDNTDPLPVGAARYEVYGDEKTLSNVYTDTLTFMHG